jgi:spore coat protein CotH
MISSKRIITIIAILAAVSLISYFFLVFFMDKQTNQSDNYSVEMEYEVLLFDTDEIISIDILMDDSEWNDMIENAINEEYYKCDIMVNGTTIYSVGIRPKGNTSLSAIASDPENNRYSFKVEFDHYIERQTCFGLDKLILNNNYADATNMKEAVIYDMFQYLGADASLYNYAEISINGDYWGVYLALEAVEESFILRNYGAKR